MPRPLKREKSFPDQRGGGEEARERLDKLGRIPSSLKLFERREEKEKPDASTTVPDMLRSPGIGKKKEKKKKNQKRGKLTPTRSPLSTSRGLGGEKEAS